MECTLQNNLYICINLKAKDMITTVQFKTLDDLYKFYNEAIFEGNLAECIVNMSRHGGAYGFFAANRWRSGQGDKQIVHEISINPDYMNRTDKEWHSTLVHEMCHLWQEDNGSPSRRGYHNKEWAKKMIEVGLMPSDTGAEGGKMTGQSVTHYVIEGGLFDRVFNTLKSEDLDALRLKYLPTLAAVSFPGSRSTGEEGEEGEEEGGEDPGKKKRQGVKIKYTCPCGVNVWGKPDLKLRCNECEGDFEPQE